MQPTLLYIGSVQGDQIHERTLCGIRRYAGLRGWNVRCVEKGVATAADIAGILASNRPVAGCIVEGADESTMLPPRSFGRLPVVYLHASPALRRRGAVCIGADNGAVARAAFAELAAGRPNAFAVVGVREGFSWSSARAKAFCRLVADAGAPCHEFPTAAGTGTFLQRLCGMTGIAFDLPTEVMFEIAERAGATTPYFWGASQSSEYAVVKADSATANGTSTVAVGSKKPNAWGLYDTAGNVWEWCRDAKTGANDDLSWRPNPFYPRVHESAVRRYRGGGMYNAASDNAYFRASARNGAAATFTHQGLGFRVAVVPDGLKLD